MPRHYLALDLGAESGRAIVGTIADGKLTLDEVHRFANPTVTLNGRLCWDSTKQWDEIKRGVRAARHVPLSGIGIDTWGVDFGLLDTDGRLIGSPMCYRDASIAPAFEAALRVASRREIYDATGIALLPFNSLYQLLALKEHGDLKAAARLLLMPDLFNYLLTGVPRAETSIASTSQLYDARSKQWATAFIERFGLPTGLLPPLVSSGTVLGKLLPKVAKECELSDAPEVIAVAGHDTASAVVAVPTSGGDDWCYLSSGTWSLLGVELPAPLINDLAFEHDFTNEAGVGGTTRLLKNIAGLWLVQECRRQFARDGFDHSYAELAAMADQSEPCAALIDPAAPPFGQPGDMPAKIAAFCRQTNQPPPATRGATVRACLDSLAFKYRQVLGQLERVIGRRLNRIHIVGGGVQNKLLNQLTADVCQRDVYAGPIEATAIGNVVVQAMATGAVASLAAGRTLVRDSFAVEHYAPRPVRDLDALEQKFLHLCGATS